jgi:hypothetical protein
MPLLICCGILFPGLARADDPMSDAEWAYAQAFGKAAICATLNDYPTEAGVYGIASGISEDGFTPEAVAHIVNYSVETWCPQHWPLLQRMGRRARHEMAA